MTRGPWRPYAARALFASRHLFVLPSLIKSTPTPLLNSPILTHKFCRRTEELAIRFSIPIYLFVALVAVSDAMAADTQATFDIKIKKPTDQVKVKVERDTATFDVVSQSGIGGATIMSKGKWPTVVLRLHLSGLEFLTIGNGKITLNGSVLSHSGNPRLLNVVKDGKENKVEKDSLYWTEIRGFDATGKPVKGLPGKGGYFEITLPKALLESEPKSLELRWIDFYRG